eukprot:986233_1
MEVHAPFGYLANVYITDGGAFCDSVNNTECLSERTINVYCNPEDMDSPRLIGKIDVAPDSDGSVVSTIKFDLEDTHESDLTWLIVLIILLVLTILGGAGLAYYWYYVKPTKKTTELKERLSFE